MAVHEHPVLTRFRVAVGDITKTDADVIVNATDPSFSGLGELDYAVREAAGPELKRALAACGKLEEGNAVMTPAFAIRSAKWIAHTAGPRWKTGFRAEEFLLAECYRNSLKLAEEKKCESIAFPCISVGANRFPETRAAEIALKTVFCMLEAADNDTPIGRVTFVCGSEKAAQIYVRQLKRMIIDAFAQTYAPENMYGFPSFTAYYDYMIRLAELEWGQAGKYNDYCSNFTQATVVNLSKEYTSYDQYALNMGKWDYSTCLAYIIYLQRQAYWSGGEESPHYAQCLNGTVRKVLLRMKALLG